MTDRIGALRQLIPIQTEEYFNYVRVKEPSIAAFDGQFDDASEDEEKMDDGLCEITGVTKDVIGPLSEGTLSAGIVTGQFDDSPQDDAETIQLVEQSKRWSIVTTQKRKSLLLTCDDAVCGGTEDFVRSRLDRSKPVHTDQYDDVDLSLLMKPTRLLAFDSWESCTSTPPTPLPAVHVHTSDTVHQDQISATDVLLCQLSQPNSGTCPSSASTTPSVHPGNRRYNELLNLCRPTYLGQTEYHLRRIMCKSIVNATRNQTPRGRFLKQITTITCDDTNGSGKGTGTGDITTHWIDIGDERAIGETAQSLMKVNVDGSSFVSRNGHRTLTPNALVVSLGKMNDPNPAAGGNPTQANINTNVNVTPAVNVNVSTDSNQRRELTESLLSLSQANEPSLYPHGNNNNHHHHQVEYAYLPPSSKQWEYPGGYPTQPIPPTVNVNANLHTNPTLFSGPRPGHPGQVLVAHDHHQHSNPWHPTRVQPHSNGIVPPRLHPQTKYPLPVTKPPTQPHKLAHWDYPSNTTDNDCAMVNLPSKKTKSGVFLSPQKQTHASLSPSPAVVPSMRIVETAATVYPPDVTTHKSTSTSTSTSTNTLPPKDSDDPLRVMEPEPVLSGIH